MDFYLSGTAYNEFFNFVTTKLGLKTQAVGQNGKKKMWIKTCQAVPQTEKKKEKVKNSQTNFKE